MPMTKDDPVRPVAHHFSFEDEDALVIRTRSNLSHVMRERFVEVAQGVINAPGRSKCLVLDVHTRLEVIRGGAKEERPELTPAQRYSVLYFVRTENFEKRAQPRRRKARHELRVSP